MSHWRGLSLVCPRCRGELAARPPGAACRQCDAEYGEQEGVLELVVGGRGTPGFDPHFFSTLREVEDRHFWFVGRRQVVLSVLRRAVPEPVSQVTFIDGLRLLEKALHTPGAVTRWPMYIRNVKQVLRSIE